MEIDRRGFFGRVVGAVVALVVGPKAIAEISSPSLLDYDAVFAATMKHYSTAMEAMILAPHPMYTFLKDKMKETSTGIAEVMDRAMYDPQLRLFPPHIPQVPLEDGWAAWEDAEQLPLSAIEDSFWVYDHLTDEDDLE